VIALKFTRHGPVLHQDPAARRAFALRSVWFEPGSAPYLGSLAYLGVRKPEDFARAMRHWNTPPVNHVYADSGGNIAWITAGRTPRRPNWDGLLPVPGDGRYEWDGFHAAEDLPREINPGRGFVATANEMNLPADYPYAERKLSFEWSEKSRAVRIKEALAAQPKHGLEDSMALQCDVLSIPARRLQALLARLEVGDGGVSEALRLLLGWDCRLERDSAAAALSEIWLMRHLKPASLAKLAGGEGLLKLLTPGDTGSILAALEEPEAWPRLANAKVRDALLAETLAAAFADCRGRLGQNPAVWAWGGLHHGYFEHALSPIDSDRKAARDVGPLPVGGSGSTPMNMTYRLNGGRVTSGATFRMVVDVGNWDNSRVITAPGESGRPSSKHYRDLAPVWAEGGYVPFLYSREAVDAAIEQRILLEPAA
jgi:penicillin amidase